VNLPAQLDVDTRHGIGAGLRYRSYAAGLLVALGLGVAIVTMDTWLPNLKRLILYAGNAYLVAAQAGGTREGGTSEYIVVLRGEEWRDAALEFIASDPRMAYAGKSVYPRSVRVALQVPVSDAQKALEAQPYVKFVMPDLPLLFCH